MYSIKRVSELLGIPVVTIRAWENRYKIINPVRSEGGHRLFTNEDLEKLRFLKRHMDENGVRISEAIRLLQQQSSSPPPLEPAINPKPDQMYGALNGQLYEQLIQFNTTQANEVIDLAFSLYNFDTVFRHVLVAVLYRIGEEWEAGILTVAQEHFASQLIMNRFSQFFRILPVNERLPVVLAFCPEGEHHQIGLMQFSLFLKKKGVEVIYLGPNTPFDGIVSLIRLKKVSMLTISVTVGGNVEALNRWMLATSQAFPDLKFVLGGAAFGRSEDGNRLQHPNISYPCVEEWDAWLRKEFQIF